MTNRELMHVFDLTDFEYSVDYKIENAWIDRLRKKDGFPYKWTSFAQDFYGGAARELPDEYLLPRTPLDALEHFLFIEDYAAPSTLFRYEDTVQMLRELEENWDAKEEIAAQTSYVNITVHIKALGEYEQRYEDNGEEIYALEPVDCFDSLEDYYNAFVHVGDYQYIYENGVGHAYWTEDDGREAYEEIQGDFEICKNMGALDLEGFFAAAGECTFPEDTNYTIRCRGKTYTVSTEWADAGKLLEGLLCPQEAGDASYDAYTAMASMLTDDEFYALVEANPGAFTEEEIEGPPKFEKLVKLSAEEVKRRVDFLGACANLLNDRATMAAILNAAEKHDDGKLDSWSRMKIACSGIADGERSIYAITGKATGIRSFSVKVEKLTCLPEDHRKWKDDFISTPHDGLRITEALRRCGAAMPQMKK